MQILNSKHQQKMTQINKRFYLTLIISFLCIYSPVHAETFYRWIDDKGNEQYSNTPPRGYEEGDEGIEVLQDVKELTTKGEFVKQTIRDDAILQITDDEWSKKFSALEKEPPELPTDNEEALSKVNRIIADEQVYIELQKKRLSNYVSEYAKRKNDYDMELEEEKNQSEDFDINFWKSRVTIEKPEEYEYRKNKYKSEIRYHGLIIAWAKQKRLIAQNAIARKKTKKIKMRMEL